MKFALTAVLAAAVLTICSPAGAAKKSCVLAGGDATMITPDLAKFMANAALNNSIKGMSATAAGEVKMTCTGPNPLTTCQARQRACK